MKHSVAKKALTLKTLTKNSIWDLQENDVFRLWAASSREADVRENNRHYLDLIRVAFTIEEITDDAARAKPRYEKQGYKVGQIRLGDGTKAIMAIRKRPIMRPSDLTYENIHHITATKLLEVLDRNFGGGWDSLPQSTQDIIESRFDISTTTLPKDRLHKPGGMYEKKVADGFEALEVAKGTWVEAIFAKLKPEMEKPRVRVEAKREADEEEAEGYDAPETDEEEEIEEPEMFDEDDITEDNYRTTFEIEGDPEEEAEGMSEAYGEE